MRREGMVFRVWKLLRTYGVAVFLVVALLQAFIEVYTTGTGPLPQLPPDGFIEVRARIELGWSKSTRKGEVKLQVSKDDARFADPFINRAVTGESFPLNELEAGHRYYWRLVQDGKSSPVAFFDMSPYATRYGK